MDLQLLRSKIVEIEKKVRYGNGNLAELRLQLKGLNEQLAEAEKAAFDAWGADAKKAVPR
jgi:hypothetical protein